MNSCVRGVVAPALFPGMSCGAAVSMGWAGEDTSKIKHPAWVDINWYFLKKQLGSVAQSVWYTLAG